LLPACKTVGPVSDLESVSGYGPEVVEAFLGLSARLTGFARAALPGAMAEHYLLDLKKAHGTARVGALLDAFVAEGNAIHTGESSPFHDMARQIVMGWYNGHFEAEVQEVFAARGYQRGLVWKTAGTKPM